MRYLNGDLNQPSPLYTRLWEARRGFLVGFVFCVLLLGFVVGVLFALALFERGASGVNYGQTGLWFLWRVKGSLLLVGCYSIFLVWKRELDLVNEDTETIEQIIDSRLKAIERRVFPESFPQPEHPETP